LESPAYAPWVRVLLGGFPDLVASKMVALVERGGRFVTSELTLPSRVNYASKVLAIVDT